jgi:hypothetical protein
MALRPDTIMSVAIHYTFQSSVDCSEVRDLQICFMTFGVLGFDCQRGLGILLCTTASRTVLKPTQPPIQWVPGSLSLTVKRPGREADHSLPSSAEVKNARNYTSTPLYVFMERCLVKHRDNFTFTLPHSPHSLHICKFLLLILHSSVVNV